MLNYVICEPKSQKLIHKLYNKYELWYFVATHSDIDYQKCVVICYNTLERGLNGLKCIKFDKKSHNFNLLKAQLIVEMKNDKEVRNIYTMLIKILAFEFKFKLFNKYLLDSFSLIFKSKKNLNEFINMYNLNCEFINMHNLNWIWGNGNWKKLVNSVYYRELNNFLPFTTRDTFYNSVKIQIKQSLYSLDYNTFKKFIDASP